jgi:hypothetical protein
LKDGYKRFLGKPETPRKVKFSVTFNLSKNRNCRVLEVLLPGFDIAASELMDGD